MPIETNIGNRFTPGEHQEAIQKRKDHEQGLKLAKFYRGFLTGFRNQVVLAINKANVKSQKVKLSEISGCDLESLKKYAQSAAQNNRSVLAGAGLPDTSIPIDFERFTEYTDMTVEEFERTMDLAIKSLKKDGPQEIFTQSAPSSADAPVETSAGDERKA